MFTGVLVTALSTRSGSPALNNPGHGGLSIGKQAIESLPPALKMDTIHAFAVALHVVFGVGAGIAIVGFLLTLRLREIPLRR